VFAGLSGFEVIERLIPQARQALNKGGWLVMEIGKGQGTALLKLLQGWNDIGFTADLQGIQRVALARRT
jgi:release factor glutamine methyltransferase